MQKSCCCSGCTKYDYVIKEMMSDDAKLRKEVANIQKYLRIYCSPHKITYAYKDKGVALALSILAFVISLLSLVI